MSRSSRAHVRAHLLMMAFAVAAPAFAQTPDPPKPTTLLSQAAKDESFFKFDYGVPTSPALTLAGLSPDKTTTSTSLKSFVVSLPTFLNGDDKGQAIALDFAPAALGSRDLAQATFTDYVEGHSGWQGIVNRSRIGLALFQGKEDTTSPAKSVPSKLAAGVSVSVLNSSDPLLTPGDGEEGYLLSCLKRQTPRAMAVLGSDLQAVANRSTFATDYPGFTPQDQQTLKTADSRLAEINARIAALDDAIEDPAQASRRAQNIEEQRKLSDERKALGDLRARLLDLMVARDDNGSLAKEIKSCALEASLRAETAADLDIGLGGLWRGKPGELNDFNDAGAAAWIAFRMPFHRTFERDKDGAPALKSAWLVSASGRFSTKEYLATKNATTPEFQADVSEAWVGIEYLVPDLRFSAHYGYRDIRADDAAGKPFESSSDRYLLAAKIRLGKEDGGLWLNLSYGNANGATADKDDHTALVTLSYAPTG